MAVKVVSEVAERLIRGAGYNPEDAAIGKPVFGGQHAKEFEDILTALLYIGNRKVDDYGDFRLQDIRSWDRETWGAYWDIQRKFGRLETQLQTGTDYLRAAATVPSMSEPPVSKAMMKIVNDLMESLGDQAVYCVRMIQILKRLEERGMYP